MSCHCQWATNPAGSDAVAAAGIAPLTLQANWSLLSCPGFNYKMKLSQLSHIASCFLQQLQQPLPVLHALSV